VVGVDGWWALPLCFIAGVVLLFATLHLARATVTCTASWPSTCW
jgi:hypothetical protein